MGSLGTITNSGAAGQEIFFNIILMPFKKSSWKNKILKLEKK